MKVPIPGHQEWNKGCNGRQRILAKARRHMKGNKRRHQCWETNERTNPLIPWRTHLSSGIWEKHFQICSWTLVALRDHHNKTKTKKRETPSSPAVPESKIAMSGRFPNPVPPILISQQCIDKPIAIRIGSKQGLAPRPNSSKSWVPRMSSIPKSRYRERERLGQVGFLLVQSFEGSWCSASQLPVSQSWTKDDEHGGARPLSHIQFLYEGFQLSSRVTQLWNITRVVKPLNRTWHFFTLSTRTLPFRINLVSK